MTGARVMNLSIPLECTFEQKPRPPAAGFVGGADRVRQRDVVGPVDAVERRLAQYTRRDFVDHTAFRHPSPISTTHMLV